MLAPTKFAFITDTMGYAFTFPVVSLLGNIPIGAYVHYPTISTTMLSRVRSRAQGVTNSEAISSSALLSHGKLLYVLISPCIYSAILTLLEGTIAYSCTTMPTLCAKLAS